MAPEYLAHGQLTEKADVYSYGVLLLEIVTGRQNNRSNNSEYSDSLVTIVSCTHTHTILNNLIHCLLTDHKKNSYHFLIMLLVFFWG